MTADITVENNTESRSYDAIKDGSIVGTIVYEQVGGRLVFTHTIVEPEFRGQGIGTTLVKGALDDLVSTDTKLTNFCGFVADFIDDHQEYAGVIDADHPGLERG